MISSYSVMIVMAAPKHYGEEYVSVLKSNIYVDFCLYSFKLISNRSDVSVILEFYFYSVNNIPFINPMVRGTTRFV